MGRSAELCTAMVTLMAAIVLVGCGGSEAPKRPPPLVLTSEAREQVVPIFGEWVGTTDGFVNAKIRPKVEGYLLKQEYDNGARVEKGQAMFEIDPRQFQAEVENAQGQLGRAEAALERSSQDVTRYRPLAARGAVSAKELDDAVQSQRANEASVESAKAALDQARLNLGWTSVESPIKGLAGIAVSQIGDLVSPSTVLTTVSTIDPIKVEFPISEQQYLAYERGNLEEGKRRRADVELILSDNKAYPERGTLYALAREVNQMTGTILVEATFPNPDYLLRPGLYVRVRAKINELKNAIVVPQRAVKDQQGVAQVAVVGKDNVVEMRNVTVGPTWNTLWVITKGVSKGETVIVEGLQDVRSGIKVSPKPAPAPSPAGAKAPASAGS